MSINVMTWVWKNSPAKGSALLLILALADHAHDDGSGAYPSVQTLAAKARMSVRNTQYLLRRLVKNQTIRVESNAGPKGVNLYTVVMGGVQPSIQVVQSLQGEVGFRGATQGTEVVQPIAPGGATQGTEVVQPIAPKPSLNHQRTIIEPSGVRGENRFSPSPFNGEGPEDQTVWPDWYAALYAIPGFKVPLTHAQAWLNKKIISEDHAETTAYALKSKWPGPKKDPYKDPWATFQTWVKRPPLIRNSKNVPPAADEDYEAARRAIFVKEAEEYAADEARVAQDRANHTGIFAFRPRWEIPSAATTGIGANPVTSSSPAPLSIPSDR